MAAGVLSLPVHIPWKLIAASPDMMDTSFCNKLFPGDWKSSIAISAYEPPQEDLPEQLCNERITYLKITCSISGYQPTREELADARGNVRDGISLGGASVEDLNRILEDQSYFACYGALLNVAVFPYRGVLDRGDADLKDYPRIIAIEPKLRDLYQSASDSGEVLTASGSGINTTKSLTDMESTESSFSLTADVAFPITEDIVAGFGASTSRSRTESEQDTWTVQTDASHERREKQGTSTQLSQMYNLLTGYHTGTNRTTFLMLARPHVLQPTDHRTFIQGLRHIEGIQEFMVIVTRPENIRGICVEAFLETGHFPENEEPIEIPEIYDEGQFTFTAKQTAKGGTGIFNTSSECKDIEDKRVNTRTAIPTNWVIDTRLNRTDGQQGDLDHPGIIEGNDSSNTRARDTLDGYDYTIKEGTDNQVTIFGEICGKGWRGPWLGSRTAKFQRDYTVLTRSSVPKPTSQEPRVPINNLLITSRNLCACLQSGKECVEVAPKPPSLSQDDGLVVAVSIVEETGISIDPGLLTPSMRAGSRIPAMNDFLRKLEIAMMTSGKSHRRRAFGEVGYLDSDYFLNQIKKILPKDRLETILAEFGDIPTEVIESLGQECTVAEALNLDLRLFGEKTGMSTRDSIDARRVLLGLAPKTRNEVDPEGSAEVEQQGQE